jgi:hypothetical protein
MRPVPVQTKNETFLLAHTMLLLQIYYRAFIQLVTKSH